MAELELSKAVSHAQELNRHRTGIIPSTVTQALVSIKLEYPDGVVERLTGENLFVRINAHQPGLQEQGAVPHWEINAHLTLPMEKTPPEER